MSEVKEINQYASKGVKEQVDNLILQSILKMIEEAKMNNEEMLTFQLNKCPFCSKQHILVETEEVAEDTEDAGICLLCSKPVDAKVLVYQFKADDEEKQIICLESEAEELIQRPKADK